MRKLLRFIITAMAAAAVIALLESLAALFSSGAALPGAGMKLRFVLYAVSVYLLAGLAVGAVEFVLIEGGGRLTGVRPLLRAVPREERAGRAVRLLWAAAVALPLFSLPLYLGSLRAIRTFHVQYIMAFFIVGLAAASLALALAGGAVAWRLAAAILRGRGAEPGRGKIIAAAIPPCLGIVIFFAAVMRVHGGWLRHAVDFSACGYTALFLVFQVLLWKVSAAVERGRTAAWGILVLLLAAAGFLGAVTPLLVDGRVLLASARATSLEKRLVAALRTVAGPVRGRSGVSVPPEELVYVPPKKYIPDREALGKMTGGTEGMNVILVTVDALRADHLGCYGYGRDTSPNIDTFAKDNVLFEWAFIQAADSPNSLFRLFTSRYLVNTLKPGGPETLARIMGANGYETAAVYDGEVWNRYRRNLLRGFDTYLVTPFTYDRIFKMSTAPEINRLALGFIRENRDKKFFLWMHYLEPHLGYLRHPELRDYGRGPMDAYDSEIAYMDTHFGELLGELRSLGLYEKSLIVFTADHGETFREHGETAHGRQLYNESIHVPLIMKLPGVKGKVVPEKVKAIDVVPTLVQLLDLKTDARFDGTSLVPLVYFNDARYLTPVYTWVTWPPLDAKMIAEGDWKLIYTTRDNSFELYNLKDDPGERVNVVDENPDIARGLAGDLFAWIKFKLGGRVPRGQGKSKRAAGKRKVVAKEGKPQAGLREPRDAALGPDGTLYVADFGNRCVRVFNPEGKQVATWGAKGEAPGKFRDPSGVAVDREGNVYVADTWNQRIQKFSREGKFLKEFKEGFYAPAGVAVDAQGNICVADTGNGRVAKLSPAGKLLWRAGRKGSGPGEFSSPIGVAVADDGRILVADSGNRRIQVLDRGGKFKKPIPVDGWPSGVFNLPYLEAGDKGAVYVTDPMNNRILEISSRGEVIGELKPRDAGGDVLNRPTGIAVDRKGRRIHVVDTWNHRVRRYNLDEFTQP